MIVRPSNYIYLSQNGNLAKLAGCFHVESSRSVQFCCDFNIYTPSSKYEVCVKWIFTKILLCMERVCWNVFFLEAGLVRHKDLIFSLGARNLSQSSGQFCALLLIKVLLRLRLKIFAAAVEFCFNALHSVIVLWLSSRNCFRESWKYTEWEKVTCANAASVQRKCNEKWKLFAHFSYFLIQMSRSPDSPYCVSLICRGPRTLSQVLPPKFAAQMKYWYFSGRFWTKPGRHIRSIDYNIKEFAIYYSQNKRPVSLGRASKFDA